MVTKPLSHETGNFRGALVDFAGGLNEPADGLDQSLIDGIEHRLRIVRHRWIGKAPMRLDGRPRPRKCRTSLACG